MICNLTSYCKGFQIELNLLLQFSLGAVRPLPYLVQGSSINYVITIEGARGCQVMMVDDGRGGGHFEVMTLSSVFFELKFV